jgi:MFS family permease
MIPRRAYPWIIPFTTMFTLFVTNGIPIGGLSVFDEPLLNEFGWSRSALKFRDLLTFGTAGLLGPLAGALADKLGVRRLMLFGAVLLGISLFFYAHIQSAVHMYIIHLGFALTVVFAGLIVNVMLVSRWFEYKRGTAVGLTLIGTSLGGIVLAPLGNYLIQTFGWRRAFQIEIALPILLILVILLIMRDAPEHMGLEPHRKPDPKRPDPLPDTRAVGVGAAGTKPGELPGLSYGAAMRTGTFWALALVAMTTFFSILGVSAHLFLHLRDLGVTPERAAVGISLLFSFGLLGKFVIGMLADLMDHKWLFLINLSVMFAGSLCLASMSVVLFWPFLILFGLGWGGLYTLLQVLIVDTFGLKASGKILGTITVLDAIGGGLGPFVIGYLFDTTGNYFVPFTVVAGLIFVAMICATMVRRNLVEHAH